MKLADAMLLHKRSGDLDAAISVARDALTAELEATELAFSLGVSVRTRLVLLRSASELAREAHEYERGLRLCVQALSQADLWDFREEILRSLDTFRTFEHLRLSGISLSDDALQLSVSGMDAAPGFAKADEINRRVKDASALVKNARKRLVAASSSGNPTNKLVDVVEPYLSVARAASYAVSVRFGYSSQVELDLEDRKEEGSIRQAIDEVIALARVYADGGPSAVKRLVKDDSYASQAVNLLRDMSPDDHRISTVGITVFRDGAEVPVALPSRRKYDKPLVPFLQKIIKNEALPPEEFQVNGKLLEGNAIKSERATATLVDEDGSKVKLEYNETELGDVIGNYWKQQVVATLRRRSGSAKLWLVHVDQYE
ncbi:MAG: hypothetical protein HEQ38_04880 [Gemmatimonas sp.]|nr:hypothetical protein [Gemmatimonas sp.]